MIASPDFNKLSWVLIALTFLTFGGSGILNFVGMFVPYWSYICAFSILILLIVSYIQIIKNNERGLSLNLISSFNLLLYFLVLFNATEYLSFFTQYSSDTEIAIIFGVSVACLAIAVVHSLFQKSNK